MCVKSPSLAVHLVKQHEFIALRIDTNIKDMAFRLQFKRVPRLLANPLAKTLNKLWPDRKLNYNNVHLNPRQAQSNIGFIASQTYWRCNH